MGGQARAAQIHEEQKEALPGHGNPGNFANRPTEEVKEIASMGGQARAAQIQEEQKEALPGHGNPGNFANRPMEEVREAGSKGGAVGGI